MAVHSNLLEIIASPENLLSAWRSIRGNIPKYRRSRSRGPDQVSLAEFERDLPAQLGALQDMLLKGRYQPLPPARFTLPKRDGGERQVCVLSVRDRVAQRAAQQVIEPLWEPEFLDCSFGFRPGLSIETAILSVRNLRSQGNGWVVDGDIANCFDTLDHDLLMARLRRKIGDRRVLHLVQAWLDAGVMTSGLPHDPEAVPLGSLEPAASFFRRSVDWAIDTFIEGDDPYAASRYEPGEGSESAWTDSGILNHTVLSGRMHRQSLKRVAVNSLLWGASWARPAAVTVGRTTRAVLSSPAGRRLLKRGALASGGLAGVAAAAAIAAFILQRKAGPAPAGVLQGSPLSPLLANIYLHPFDVQIARKSGHCLARFADDWVILCPNQERAEVAYNDALRTLARLCLKVNPEKTRLLSPKEQLEWLGALIK